VTCDPSILFSAPDGFQIAFQDAINLYQTTYTDQITINIDVGWGEIDGNPLNPGNLGQSRTNQPSNFTCSQVRNALMNDAKSAADFQAISTLGVTDLDRLKFDWVLAEFSAAFHQLRTGAMELLPVGGADDVRLSL
jgi:hypothetical protein